jgi:hypothetical protein
MLHRKFCILKKKTFIAFHYLTLLIRCEEIDAHINKLYLFLKSTYWEHILGKMLSTSMVLPILAFVAPSPLISSFLLKAFESKKTKMSKRKENRLRLPMLEGGDS